MKIVLIILGAILGLLTLVTIIGALLPKKHTATRTTVVQKSLAEVYAFALARANDPQYEILEKQPERRLVTRIADRNLPYSGLWIITLMPEGGGTRVTITERGEVYNPFFRFVSRFVIGHTATIDQYLTDLAAAKQ